MLKWEKSLYCAKFDRKLQSNQPMYLDYVADFSAGSPLNDYSDLPG